MKQIQFQEFRLIGIGLEQKTTNADGQSQKDLSGLWQKFATGDYFNLITEKTSNRILAVYHNYEGDHTQPFDYFIGCEVGPDAKIPEGMTELHVPASTYHIQSAFGKIPDCIAVSWRDIWASEINRKYTADFEVYDHRSRDINEAMVDIFVSIED